MRTTCVAFGLFCVVLFGSGARAAPAGRHLAVVGGGLDCLDEHASCPARAATLELPEFIGVHDGHLYISNHEGWVTKRVSLASEAIEDYLPWQGYFDWDADGNFWSLHEFHILRVSPEGQIDICAGSGDSDLAIDGAALATGIPWGGGIAVGPDGKVYFAHYGAVRVLEGCGETGTVSTLRDGFNWAEMVAFDGAGNLYVTDYARVQRFGPTGEVEVLGDDFWYPRIAFDAAGDRLLIAEYLSGVFWTYDPHGRTLETLDLQVAGGTPDNMRTPSHICSDEDGHLYVADDTNAAVYRCGRGGDCARFAGHGSALPGPADANNLEAMNAIACDERGRVCYLSFNFTRLYRLDADGTLSAMSAEPLEFAVESGDGGPVGAATFRHITSLAVDQANGDLYVAQRFGIRKVDGRTGIITTITGGPDMGVPQEGARALGQPIGWVDFLHASRGVLYFNSLVFGDQPLPLDGRFLTIRHGRIHTLVGADGHYAHCPDGSPARDTCIAWPWGIALNELTGDIFFADADNHLVRRIDARDGRVYTVAGDGFGMQGEGRFAGDGGPAIEASLFFPGGLAFDPAGDLYIKDAANFVVRKVVPARNGRRPRDWDYAHGIISTVAGVPRGSVATAREGGAAGAVQIGLGIWMAFDGGGNLYVTQDGLDLGGEFHREGVLWRVQGALQATLTGTLPTLTVAFESPEAIPGSAIVTAQVIDAYDRHGPKVAATSVSFEAGRRRGVATFDLPSGELVPDRVRIETRAASGLVLSRDLPAQP